MPADTVAKLLHEWQPPDRPPDPHWRLPAGTTVIVDEAGMLDTGDLHQLTQLADQQQWRLALIGDPHQLQAVGRGGMFAELCATGRTIELEHIHRFTNHWEAAASLQLRHGDPTGLDAYEHHDRIIAGTFAEHLDNIATHWTGAHAARRDTRDHDHHQRPRRRRSTTPSNTHRHRPPVSSTRPAVADRRRRALHVGDVVATRRNQRHLHTSTGDSVRNRDCWTDQRDHRRR